ncbi:MAG: hypothetical protein ACKVJG_08015 [Candidatus Latescibacterota bacterium]
MAGRASIGHTRYATSGAEDVRYAQPFERHHGRRWKWFSFGFNGQLANYVSLRDELRDKRGYHFSLDTYRNYHARSGLRSALAAQAFSQEGDARCGGDVRRGV